MYKWEDPNPKLFDHPDVPTPHESAPISRLTQGEVYKELRLRGYDYGPQFQGIYEATLEGGQAQSPSVSVLTRAALTAGDGKDGEEGSRGPGAGEAQGADQPLRCR